VCLRVCECEFVRVSVCVGVMCVWCVYVCESVSVSVCVSVCAYVCA